MSSIVFILLDITKGSISNEALLFWGKVIGVGSLVIVMAIVMYECGLRFYQEVKNRNNQKKGK